MFVLPLSGGVMNRNTQGLLVFIAVLVILRVVLRVRISIIGSLVLTAVVWVIVDQWRRRSG